MNFKILNNKIYVSNYTKEFVKFLDTNLKIYNEMHRKAQFLNIPKWQIPEFLYFYKADKNDNLILNIALLNTIKHFFKKEDIEREVNLNYRKKSDSIREEKTKKGIELFDYQNNALKSILEAYKNNQIMGILEARPGSGKTEIFLKLIDELKLKTIIVAHTIDLIQQTKKRFESYYNYKTHILSTKNTERDIENADVIFTTIQTLSRIDINKLSKIDLVIIDECHHFPSNGKKTENKYISAIYNLKFKFLLGATATNYRADMNKENEHIPLLASLGNVIHRIKKEETSKNTIQKVEILFKTTGFTINDITDLEFDGTFTWSGLINSISEDDKRNQLIKETVLKQLQESRKVIILCDRIKHIEILSNLFSDLKYKVLIGKTKDRDDIITEAKNGNVDIIITNYQLFTEGIDLPNFDTLILATPRKFKGTLQQSIGRIQRIDKTNNDKAPRLIDIVDNEITTLRKMAIERNKFYKSEKY